MSKLSISTILPCRLRPRFCDGPHESDGLPNGVTPQVGTGWVSQHRGVVCRLRVMAKHAKLSLSSINHLRMSG